MCALFALLHLWTAWPDMLTCGCASVVTQVRFVVGGNEYVWMAAHTYDTYIPRVGASCLPGWLAGWWRGWWVVASWVGGWY